MKAKTKELADSVGAVYPVIFMGRHDGVLFTETELETFVTLVAEHKAEVITAEAYRGGYKDGMKSAAVICENLPVQQDRDVRDECAAAIRARGTT
tara:strand:- start:433 stop:717 length:285 start_codon:yes stop_codon:yes gene_type:complete